MSAETPNEGWIRFDAQQIRPVPPSRYDAVRYGRDAILGLVAAGRAMLVEDVAEWLRASGNPELAAKLEEGGPK